jgi:sugar phosphate isomerase/epimerase
MSRVAIECGDMTKEDTMTTRRSFLGAVAGGLGAAVACGRAEDVREEAPAGEVAEDVQKPPLGLQLWSVRHLLEKDLPGTLKQIKAWGIDDVESAGFYERSAAEFASELEKAGLGCPSMHIGWDALDQDLDGVIADAEVVGATTIIQPSLPHATRGSATREEMLRAAEAFARWSERIRAAGKRFGYHIHGQEFGPATEGTLFDTFAEEVGPDVGFELDVFWAVSGGADPLELMRRYAGRIWYTHLKDMSKEDLEGEDANVVLGTGRIDVAGIVKAGPSAGVEIHVLEDESADPAGNIPRSIAYYEGLEI